MDFGGLGHEAPSGCSTTLCRMAGRIDDLEKMLTKRIESAERRRRTRVWMRGNHVYAGDGDLDLSKRRLGQRLFRYFLSQEGLQACEADLIRAIYGIDVNGHYSRRMVDAAHESLLKLVSRMRLDTDREFGPSLPEWEWFPFDHRTNCWRLYGQPPLIGDE